MVSWPLPRARSGSSGARAAAVAHRWRGAAQRRRNVCATRHRAPGAAAGGVQGVRARTQFMRAAKEGVLRELTCHSTSLII
jgi:hypothetical protein